VGSWYRALVGIELRKIFAYRANFWVEFFGTSLGHFGIAYFVWRAVYGGAGAETLGGYTFASMLLYQLLVPIIGKATYSLDFSGIGDEVYTGALNRYLVYPVSFFSFRYVQTMTSNLVLFVQLAIALLAFHHWIGFPPDFALTPVRFAIFVAALACGISLAFLISWSVQLVAFWAESVWSLMVSYRLLVLFLGGAWIPLSLFPEGMANLLRWLPFRLLVSFPIEIFMGRLSPAEMRFGFALILGWMIVLSLIGRAVWRAGLKTYSGVGI